MDWKIFLTTFGTIFLAELGDKTQLAAIMMTSETKLPGRYLQGISRFVPRQAGWGALG
jgi:putative Ca2+/H+ antiporter (TMEM165/GDT1 family)